MTNNNDERYGGYVPEQPQNDGTQQNTNNDNAWYASKSYGDNANINSNDTTQQNIPQQGSPYTSNTEQYNQQGSTYSDNIYSQQTSHTPYGDEYTGAVSTDGAYENISSNSTTADAQGYSASNTPEGLNQPLANSYFGQQPQQPQHEQNSKKPKDGKRMGKGAMAVLLAVCMLASGGIGFGGCLLAENMSSNGLLGSGSGMTIQKVVNTVNATDSSSSEMSTEDIVTKTQDSVVEITTEVVQTGSLSKQYVSSGAGSGVVISDNGYIITNNHVIDGAEKIVVTMHDGTTYDATLVGKDSQQDVALLKVEATGLTAATFGDSDKIATGQKVVAIGNPLGQLGGTVTDGIISATSREIVIDNVTMNLIQISAAINPGNSGGGLFNAQGELIGLVNAKTVDEEVEGLGFAIPINDVESLLSDLKEYGYVKGRPEIGLSLVDVTTAQSAMMYGVNDTGVYIGKITGTEAKTAGFQVGDRITKVNGTAVSTSAEISKILQDCKAGDTLKVTVDREGVETEISTVLGEASQEEATEAATQSSNNGFSSGDYYGSYGGNSGNYSYGSGQYGYSSGDSSTDSSTATY